VFPDLLVTPTGVRILSTVQVAKRPDSTRRGYHFVAVDVRATNTGKLPNCTNVEAFLTTDGGYDYTARRPDDPSEPKLGDLLGGEVATGSYVFEVEDALIPRWLTVLQRTGTWRGCEVRGHVDLIAPRVRLPLTVH